MLVEPLRELDSNAILFERYVVLRVFKVIFHELVRKASRKDCLHMNGCYKYKMTYDIMIYADDFISFSVYDVYKYLLIRLPYILSTLMKTFHL